MFKNTLKYAKICKHQVNENLFEKCKMSKNMFKVLYFL